jgi:hypothetical protein
MAYDESPPIYSDWRPSLWTVAALCLGAAGGAWLFWAAAPAGWWMSLSVLGLGLVFGLKHALDADHLAAVSAIVSEGSSVWRSTLVGAVWGLGHTAAVLAAGALVIGLGMQIGHKTALSLEMLVAVMLVGLGLNALRLVWRGVNVHVHVHQHGGRAHIHPHVHRDEHGPGGSHHGSHPGMRPFWVGLVHGLAGSAALMLLVLSTLPSPTLGFAYLTAFAIGSLGGMVMMSTLVGIPLQLTAQRYLRAHAAIRAAAGAGSVLCGLLLAYDIGVVQGLLL